MGPPAAGGDASEGAEGSGSLSWCLDCKWDSTSGKVSEDVVEKVSKVVAAEANDRGTAEPVGGAYSVSVRYRIVLLCISPRVVRGGIFRVISPLMVGGENRSSRLMLLSKMPGLTRVSATCLWFVSFCFGRVLVKFW